MITTPQAEPLAFKLVELSLGAWPYFSHSPVLAAASVGDVTRTYTQEYALAVVDVRGRAVMCRLTSVQVMVRAREWVESHFKD